MPGELQLLLAAAALMAGVALVYWCARPRRRLAWNGNTIAVFVLVTLGVLFCGWSIILEKPEYSYVRKDSPLAIVIVFDLSPSMLAIPDPQFQPDFAPRFERAKDTLIEFFGSLQERQEQPLVAILGFTRQAEILMGWDQNTTQIREVLEYSLSPDLFGSSGTSIESAVRKIDDVFEMLPEEFRGSSRKLVLFVSDGEDTLPPASLQYALSDLAKAEYEVIALQAGLLDEMEGVPQFGRTGEFLGFQNYSGRYVTTPDVGAMRSLAESTKLRGLYVRAEDLGATARMVDFTARMQERQRSLDASLMATLGMFAVVGILCMRLLR